jgi:hypothetical protein
MNYNQLIESDIPTGKSTTKESFQALYDRAWAAGVQAANTVHVTPMYVGTPTTPFGNDIDPTKTIYKVDSGVCGFASVQLKPATSAFAKWLKAQGYAKRDEYRGGVYMWISAYGQSLTRKEAHANAMAKVLRDAGYKAYSWSRMD